MPKLITQKLLAHPSVFRLSDLHLIHGDLLVARQNFFETIGQCRLIMGTDIAAYSMCCSGLIHYRRAFNTGVRKNSRLTDEIVKQVASEHLQLHQHLLDLTDKYVAHSCNEYEQLGVTVQVALDEAGSASFCGLGQQASSIELLGETKTKQSIALLDQLRDRYIAPEIKRLEEEITVICNGMTPEQLKALPAGFAPVSDASLRKIRSWPHRGRY